MKYNRKIYTSISVILFIITVITIFTFRQKAQNNQKTKEDSPTIIQPGVMTAKQLKHSKLYEEESLLLQPSLLNKTENTVYVTIFSGPILTENNLKNKTEILQKVSCKSDVIVSGKIKNKSSQITENQSFVFTDYEVEIKDVIKNYSALDLANTKNLNLTAKGGAVKSGDRVFKVIVERSVPLLVNNDYIFFLNYLPDSQSFRLTNEQSLFQIFPDANNVVFEQQEGKSLSEDLETFLKSLRQTTTNGCLR